VGVRGEAARRWERRPAAALEGQGPRENAQQTTLAAAIRPGIKRLSEDGGDGRMVTRWMRAIDAGGGVLNTGDRIEKSVKNAINGGKKIPCSV